MESKKLVEFYKTLILQTTSPYEFEQYNHGCDYYKLAIAYKSDILDPSYTGDLSKEKYPEEKKIHGSIRAYKDSTFIWSKFKMETKYIILISVTPPGESMRIEISKDEYKEISDLYYSEFLKKNEIFIKNKQARAISNLELVIKSKTV